MVAGSLIYTVDNMCENFRIPGATRQPPLVGRQATGIVRRGSEDSTSPEGGRHGDPHVSPRPTSLNVSPWKPVGWSWVMPLVVIVATPVACQATTTPPIGVRV